MHTARKQSAHSAPAEDRWLSLPKAAAALKKSRQGVLVAIAKGELQSENVAGRIVVARASVDAMIATQRGRRSVAIK